MHGFLLDHATVEFYELGCVRFCNCLNMLRTVSCRRVFVTVLAILLSDVYVLGASSGASPSKDAYGSLPTKLVACPIPPDRCILDSKTCTDLSV